MPEIEELLANLSFRETEVIMITQQNFPSNFSQFNVTQFLLSREVVFNVGVLFGISVMTPCIFFIVSVKQI